MKNWVFGVLCLFASCALKPIGDPPYERSIYGSLPGEFYVRCDSCSPEFLDRILAEWNQALGFEYLKPWTPDIVPYRDAVIWYTDDLSRGDAWGEARYSDRPCSIKIRPAHRDNIPLHTHELGHCLGFLHSLDPSSIMWRRLYPGQLITQEHIDIVHLLIAGSYYDSIYAKAHRNDPTDYAKRDGDVEPIPQGPKRSEGDGYVIKGRLNEFTGEDVEPSQ